MNFKTPFFVVLLIVAWSFGSASQTWAISFTQQIVGPGNDVSDRPGWPAGAVEFINDPLRTTGWHHFFSGAANDWTLYFYRARDMAQLNRLIASFAEIESDELVVALSTADARQRGTKYDGEVAELRIGNQEALDFWFDRLKKDADDRRIFGVHRLDKPPTAMVPTLTIFVSHELVDLDQLEVPARLRVVRGHSREKSDRDDAIDAFVERHQAAAK